MNWDKSKSFVVKNRRRVVMSSCTAILLIVISYFIDSSPYSIGGEISIPQWMERVSYIFGSRSENLPDSILLVNVAYDKKLVDYEAPCTTDTADPRKMPAGRLDITDRKKLADFLNAAANADYRYIVLDIRFDDDVPTDTDARRLFSMIDTMPRVLFACHHKTPVSPDAPLQKAAYSDYYTTMTETNLVKYPLMKHEKLSVPAKMFQELNGREFSSFMGLPTENGKLIKPSIFLTYPVNITNWLNEDASGVTGAKFNYLNLGNDILQQPDSVNVVKNLVKGKIVVVGDFVNDLHTSYVGTVMGPLVNINAYLAMCEGRHYVKFYITVILFIIYFQISYTLYSKKNFIEKLPFIRNSRSTLLRVIVSFIGFTTFLYLTSGILYLCFGVIYSVVFPSLYFTLLDLWIQKREN